VLENYTFLTRRARVARRNVYAGLKGQILKGFSNMHEKQIHLSPAYAFSPAQLSHMDEGTVLEQTQVW
jgi:hypothetical protein